jgi:L-threonylcarbamoyladenylate synthase
MLIERAAEILKQGGIVAFPTETVYGLGASVFNTQAIQRIFQVKGRPQDNPLIVHIASLDQLSCIVSYVPDAFHQLAEQFFPGPLTILLPRLETVPEIVSAHLPHIGVRMPDHPIAQNLIKTVGTPLVAPSANLSGKPSSTRAEHVQTDFGNRIDGILDGGPCQCGIESTVMALLPFPRILRPGAVTRTELEEVLKMPIPYADAQVEKPLSPGMKYRHYAPLAKVVVFHTQELLTHYLDNAPQIKRLVTYHIEPVELYSLLRRADTENYEEIVIFCDASMQGNVALMNRITRAAHPF